MSRRSESVAPSLFPFLAVLLCTMGALVLMLLLLVVGAQSSAKEVADKVEDELEWQQDQLQTVKNSLVKKYDEAKIEIEKKRLHLQNIEQHIHELKEELDLLDQTAKAADQKQDTQKETLKQRDALREALEKQLIEAKKTLESKIKDPKGDKPIFAIIPYDGPNGTHRRPIYLECNAKGLVVQPEGVVLTPADLSPPYGPGNPLDAVLRTIRAEFPSRDGSVDSNPYPLLVVRPSGIKNYMMARAAMSGWDDQFGYELISEDLELSFPASTANLQKKIASTIEAARQRQAALVLSMPQHYDASQLDFYGSGGGSGGSMEDVSDQFQGLSGSGQGSGQSGYASQGSSGKRGGMSMMGGTNQGAASPNGQIASSGMNGNGTNPPSLAQSLAQSPSGKTDGPGWTFGQSAANAAGGNPPGSAANQDPLAQGGNSGGTGQMSFFGGGSSEDGYGLTKSGTLSNSRIGGMGGGTYGGDSVSGDGSPSDGSSDGSKPASGNSASATADTSAGGNTSLWNAAQAKANGANSSSGGGSSGGGSASMNANPMSGSTMAGSNIPSTTSGDPSQLSGQVQNVGMNFDMNKKSQDAKPVAQSKGRGWAWRDGNRSQTAIVRAIWLQCYKDRWIVRPDKGSNNSALTIKLEGSPMQRAERLAAAVQQRVEGWGVALAGGHWAPVIHVEVASDAEDQFTQLQKLMEGSGIDVIRKGTISPQVFK